MPLLYKIPQKLTTAVGSGEAKLIGAIIKDSTSGKILGHVQQTTGFAQAINQVMGLPMDATTGALLPGVVTIVQNEQIKNRLAELAKGIGLMQNLQYLDLGLGAVNLGVTIASTFIILEKIEKIDRRLDNISEQIKHVTTDRREDERQNLIAEIKSDIENIHMYSAIPANFLKMRYYLFFASPQIGRHD